MRLAKLRPCSPSRWATVEITALTSSLGVTATQAFR